MPETPSSASTASSGSSHSECSTSTDPSPTSTESDHQLPSVLTLTAPPSPTLPYSAYSQPVHPTPLIAASNPQRRYSFFSFNRKSTPPASDQNLNGVHRSDPNLKGKLMAFFAKSSPALVASKKPNAPKNETPAVAFLSPAAKKRISGVPSLPVSARSFSDHSPVAAQLSKQQLNRLSTSSNILKPLTDQQLKAHNALMGTPIAEKSAVRERSLSNASSMKSGHAVVKSVASPSISTTTPSASNVPTQPVKPSSSPVAQEFSASAFVLGGKDSLPPSSKKLPPLVKGAASSPNRKSVASVVVAKKSVIASSSDSESDSGSEDDDSQPLSDRRWSMSHFPPTITKSVSQQARTPSGDDRTMHVRKQTHSFSDLSKLGKLPVETKGTTALPKKQQHRHSIAYSQSFAAANMKNLQNQQKRISQPMMKPLPQFVLAPPNVNQQGHATTREQFIPYTMPQMLSTPPLTPIPPPIVAPARPAAATPHVIYKQQPVGYAHPSQLGYQIPGNPNPTSVVQPQFYTPQATAGIVGVAQAFPPQVLTSQSNSAFGMYSYPQQGANTRRKTLISFSRTEVETSKSLKDAAYATRALKDRAKHDEILRAREQNL